MTKKSVGERKLAARRAATNAQNRLPKKPPSPIVACSTPTVLAAAIVGWVPVVGDSAKAAIRAGRKVQTESAAEVAERAVREQSATLSRIADPEARAVAEQAVRSEALAKYEARELDVAKQMDELAAQGHGPQRHGSHITERQLDDRAMYSIDPVTGTRFDAYLKNNDGTPKLHKPTKHATKVLSDEAYVEAESFMCNNQAYKDAVAQADKLGDNRVVIEDIIRLEDVFGTDYKQHVFGKTRMGSLKHPTGSVDTDLTDGTMTAVYIKDASGKWNLRTMYPEPKK